MLCLSSWGAVVKARRLALHCLFGALLSITFRSRAPLAGDGHATESPARSVATTGWTPERVRTFVLNVEREMEKLEALEYPDPPPKAPRPTVGPCYGESVNGLVKTSLTLPRVREMVTGRAFSCYVATYLGCDNGEWIGESESSHYGPARKPFTRSKVTIVEQTPDRVVADIVEASSEEVTHGVIAEWNDRLGKYIEYTDAEVAMYKDISRFTISRDAKSVWRISDRRPSFDWECRPN
jgi:hypothetical protein